MLDCNYTMTSNWNSGSIYTCTARIVFLGDTREIVDVSYDHLPGLTNADVRGLNIINQSLTVVPRGISNFFPNLQSLYLFDVSVDEVTNSDLTGLGGLKQFRLAANVQTIESDLFINNPLLESIEFTTNPIQHVAHHVFDNLVNLTSLHLTKATCIDESTVKNRADTKLLTFKLIVNCPPSFEMTETKIVDGNRLQNKVDERVGLKTDPLVELLLESEKRVEELEGRVEALEQLGQA